MIQKLRRKFILINMLLVSLVLVAVFATIVTSNYQRTVFQSQHTLRAALTWTADAPPPRVELGKPPRDWRDGEDRHFVPAFVVTLDAAGTAIDVNGGNTVDVSDETVSQAMASLREGVDSGVISGLGLRYLREIGRDGVTRIAFADLSTEWDALYTLVLSSLLVGAAALVGFFLISLFLSGVALKPVSEAWEQQRRFVADASHELKTPLTVILTNTGILLSHRSDPIEKQVKWVEYIHDEAQRMRVLVEDLLFLAKNDAACERTITPAAVGLSALCWSALLPFESVAFEAQVALETDVAPELTVIGQADQLRRLTGILLDNAIKYAGPKGRVTVRVGRGEKNMAHLTVHNTGEPISPPHLEHLFQRFYRADNARARDSGGYGLGLAIAMRIVEGHGGTISVQSSAQGTTFVVRLPLSNERTPAVINPISMSST